MFIYKKRDLLSKISVFIKLFKLASWGASTKRGFIPFIYIESIFYFFNLLVGGVFRDNYFFIFCFLCWLATKISKSFYNSQSRKPYFHSQLRQIKKRNDFHHSSSPIISSINISNSSSQKNTGAKNSNIPISIIRLKIGSYFKSSSKFWVKVLAIQAHRTIITIIINVFCLLIGPNAQILIMI